MGDEECRFYLGPQDDCGDDDIRRMLGGKTIAVVGLSADPSKISHGVAAYLAKQGYEVVPVNPMHDEIMGRKSYPTVSDIPYPVDIVTVFRKPKDVLPVVEDAIRAGAKAVWLQLQIVNEEAYKKGVQAGMQMVMNRCIKVEHQRLML